MTANRHAVYRFSTCWSPLSPGGPCATDYCAYFIRLTDLLHMSSSAIVDLLLFDLFNNPLSRAGLR